MKKNSSLSVWNKMFVGPAPIPRWIIYFAYFMALATAGVAFTIFMDANPTTEQDLGWMLFGRSAGISLVLFLAALTKNAQYLFVGFTLRLIADSLDIIGRFLSSDSIAADLQFLVPLIIILAPIYIGAWKLWNIVKLR